jgi:hypothetical protein
MGIERHTSTVRHRRTLIRVAWPFEELFVWDWVSCIRSQRGATSIYPLRSEL